MTNWEAVEKQVSGTSKSVRAIAKEFGMSHTKLNKKIKEEGWTRYVPAVSVSSSDVENVSPHVEILGKTALRKIEEIKHELGTNYSNLDEPLIVMYAKSYEHYIKLEGKLAIEGYTIMSLKTGGRYLNPTFSALQSVQKTLVTIANQLGLSMISRKTLGLKLGDGKPKEESLFEYVDRISNEMSNIDV